MAKRQRPGDPDHSEPSPKRSSADSNFRTVKLDWYDGKLVHALKEYIRRCEITFHLGTNRYSKNSIKVLYATQFLVGETARVFERLEKTNKLDMTSWEDYKTFLRDLLQDPITRAVTLARKYNEAAQQPG